MDDYNKQALDFLDKIGAEILVRYLKFDKHFPSDEKERDIWEVKIIKDSREYIFNFGDSITNYEKWIDEIWKQYPNITGWQEARRIKQLQAMGGKYGGFKKFDGEIKFSSAGQGHRPTAYSILACMTTQEPEDNIDDFADQFGYTKTSETIRAFKATQKEWSEIKQLFSDKEIELLAEIQ